jgi:hypothetical protein
MRRPWMPARAPPMEEGGARRCQCRRRGAETVRGRHLRHAVTPPSPSADSSSDSP